MTEQPSPDRPNHRRRESIERDRFRTLVGRADASGGDSPHDARAPPPSSHRSEPQHGALLSPVDRAEPFRRHLTRPNLGADRRGVSNKDRNVRRIGRGCDLVHRDRAIKMPSRVPSSGEDRVNRPVARSRRPPAHSPSASGRPARSVARAARRAARALVRASSRELAPSISASANSALENAVRSRNVALTNFAVRSMSSDMGPHGCL